MTNMIYTAMPALPKKHHTNAVVLPSEWNTCPLSSIVEEISETVGTRKIETISISAGIGFVNQAEKFGRELSGKQYEKYIVLHKGDFSYNKNICRRLRNFITFSCFMQKNRFFLLA